LVGKSSGAPGSSFNPVGVVKPTGVELALADFTYGKTRQHLANESVRGKNGGNYGEGIIHCSPFLIRFGPGWGIGVLSKRGLAQYPNLRVNCVTATTVVYQLRTSYANFTDKTTVKKLPPWQDLCF
jgi:hypothetical protein